MAKPRDDERGGGKGNRDDRVKPAQGGGKQAGDRRDNPGNKPTGDKRAGNDRDR